MNTPQPSETPRTDAVYDKYELHCTAEEVKELHELSKKLEKELNASNRQIMMNTECIERIQKHGYELEVEIEQLKRANGEMRKALKPIMFFLQDYLRTTTHPGVSRLLGAAQDALEYSTPPTPVATIPIDVAEKMYEAVDYARILLKQLGLTHYSVTIEAALSLAKQHGLGKDKQ